MTEQNVPAGWYADPSDEVNLRYWDGSDWSTQTAPRYEAAAQQLPPPSSPQLPPPPAIQGDAVIDEEADHPPGGQVSTTRTVGWYRDEDDPNVERYWLASRPTQTTRPRDSNTSTGAVTPSDGDPAQILVPAIQWAPSEAERNSGRVVPRSMLIRESGAETGAYLYCGGIAAVAISVIVALIVGFAGSWSGAGACLLVGIGIAVAFVISGLAVGKRTSNEFNEYVSTLTPEQIKVEQESVLALNAQRREDYLAEQAALQAQAEESRNQKAAAELAWRSQFAEASGALQPNGTALVDACRRQIPLMPKSGWWLSSMIRQGVIEGVGRQLYESEAVVFVVAGETSGWGDRAIVVTTARLGVLSKKGVLWHHLSEVVSTDFFGVTVDGASLTVKTKNATYKMWDVDPKGVAKQVALALKPGAPPLSTFAQESHDNISTRCKARFMGGDFGRGPGRAALREGQHVMVFITESDELGVALNGVTVAQFQLSDPDLCIDSEDSPTIKRAVRKGPLAATAAATLILGPIGLIGLLASTEKKIKNPVTLVVQGDKNYGIFSLDDSVVGMRIKAKVEAARPKQPTEMTDRAASLAPAHGPAEAGPTTVEQLERLASLLDRGLVTQDEYEEMKARLIASS